MTGRIQVPDRQTADAAFAPPRSIAFRGWPMKANCSPLGCVFLLVALVLWQSLPALAQDADKLPEGIESGNYNMKQTAEFGGRWTGFTGNQAVYDTFVNLRSGLRLLDYTLEMRSLNHQGWLFDNFYLTNFGYGGDPNNVTRVRAYKNKWYNFTSTFRRDYTYWDYNLLANPLNLNTPVPNAPAGFSPVVVLSPHRQGLVRRLSDYSMTLLPQSRLRFRLGYSRNIQEGPSFSSFHEGTEALLFQPWKTTVNSYQVGVDFRWLPRTNISYDQFLHYYKGDTSWADQNLTFQLSNGTPVDLGLPFNVAASQPCGALPIGPPFLPPPAPPGTVNPACNGYLGYTRQAGVRTNFPTEQLSFQSNYFKSLDLSGRVMYSSGDNTVPSFNETLSGRVTRTNLRNRLEFGPATGKRVSISTDFGVTWHLTDKLRVLDMFRFASFRIPARLAFSQCAFFGTTMTAAPTVFNATASLPFNCTAPPNSTPGTPVHTASSGPDVYTSLSSRFLKQDLKNNLFELEYDLTRRFGARVGYRFRHRTIGDADLESGTFVFFPDRQNNRTPPPPFNLDADGKPVTCPAPNRTDGSCLLTLTLPGDSLTREINEHSGLFSMWARPIDVLRFSFDMELLSADNAFTRISPRQWQRYKLRANYKPMNWLSFAVVTNILESRNNVPSINNLQHDRIYGFSATFEPNERFAFDIGYDYDDIFSQIDICYVSSTAPAGLSKCPGSTVLVQQPSFYNNTGHYGYFNTMWKPFKHLTTNIGYAITSATGNALILTPNAPPGPLQYNYHKPYAGFALRLYRGLSWKADWNYYGYNEKETLVPVDFTGPRDFRGNLVTLAVRYAF